MLETQCMEQVSKWNAEFNWCNILAAVRRIPHEDDELGNVLPGRYRLRYVGNYSPWMSYKSIERAVQVLLNEFANEEQQIAFLGDQINYYGQQFWSFWYLVKSLGYKMKMGTSVAIEESRSSHATKSQTIFYATFEYCAEDYYCKFLPWINSVCIERGLRPILE